jgi:hypothetical protein
MGRAKSVILVAELFRVGARALVIGIAPAYRGWRLWTAYSLLLQMPVDWIAALKRSQRHQI